MKKIDGKDKILGLNLFGKSRQELLVTLVEHLKSGKKPLIIFTPNPEHVIQGQESPDFAQLLNQADILLPDGMGLVWASRFLAFKNPSAAAVLTERIPGVDVVADLLRTTQKNHQKVLLLGGREYQSLPPQLEWETGYQDITHPTPAEEVKVKRILSHLKPTLVLVAYGAPWQEKWVIEHRQLLADNQVKMVMVVGGAFDFLLGKVSRAPQWLQDVGLEWAYRLYQEPWRWRRQLRLLKFVALTVKEFFK